MPPQMPLNQPVVSSLPPPPDPIRRWRKWLLIIGIGLVALTGVGYGVSLVLTKRPQTTGSAVRSPAPPITPDERSKVADNPAVTTQLIITDLTADNGSIAALLAKS